MARWWRGRCFQCVGAWLAWQAWVSGLPDGAAWASQHARVASRDENDEKGDAKGWTLSELRRISLKHGLGKTLKLHGVAILPELFDAAELTALLRSFQDFRQSDEAAEFKFGELRAQRQAIHIPFQPPFDGLPLLGRDKALLAPLSDCLGQDFVLESALVISVDGGTSSMNAHTDTEDKGSISVHIPLQPLTDGFAPLSFCPGTHDDVELLDRAGAEVRRWRCIGESRMDARKRIAAGRRVKRQSLSLHWDGEASALLDRFDLQIGRSCARVRGLRGSTTLGLQVGDEITHVNELSFVAWLRIQADIEEMRSNLVLHVLRPPDVRTLTPPPNLLVGAPLSVGDAIIYDSRTVHWGMANEKTGLRHVLYLNFMSSSFQGYSPDGDAIQAATDRCLKDRAVFRKQLQRMKA
ncbi:Abcd3 [Symbiodinium sp. CCMP2592]|nr:Abcd3 [Symbiodinium sp. CCMP2592]